MENETITINKEEYETLIQNLEILNMYREHYEALEEKMDILKKEYDKVSEQRDTLIDTVKLLIGGNK